MRKISRSLGILAVAALAVTGASPGMALAATHHAPQTKTLWRAALAGVPQPKRGCYRAAYPVLRWQSVKCEAAPRVPFAPAVPRAAARHGGPAAVGDGSDYSAQVQGLISQAVGTFRDVGPKIYEKGSIGGSGEAANAFSLQLNSQFFSGSPACSGSGDPSSCQAWQQFIYADNGGGTGDVFMQYWLINYDATCPSGWYTYSEDCYTNSPATTVPTLTAPQLASTILTATAVSGGNDGVSLAVGGGTATLVTNSDSEVDLASYWNATEWGVFGDGGGSEAYFSKTTLEPVTTLTATSSAAPTCLDQGFTGETNNLSLTATPAINGKSPTMASRQTSGTATTPSCATAG